METSHFADLAAWITEAGLSGLAETELVAGFCERANAAGLRLTRGIVFVDTLHPVHEGRIFRWYRDKGKATLAEYGRTNEGERAESWRRTPFYRLLQTGERLMRLRVTPETAAEYAIIADIRDAGMTDYIAVIDRFASDGVIGEMDCVYSG